MSRAIPIPTSRPPPQDGSSLLSKSLCGDSVLLNSGFRRHISSDASHVSYKGYLLKRSNHPHPAHNPDFNLDIEDAPELPTMPGVFAPRNLKGRLGTTELPSPLEASTSIPAAVVTPSPAHRSNDQVEPVEPPKPSPIQEGLENLAAFFGITLGDKNPDQTTNLGNNSTSVAPSVDDEMVDHKLPSPPATVPRHAVTKTSAPIKISGTGGQSSDNQAHPGIGTKDSFHEAHHRRHSEPLFATPDSSTNGDSNGRSIPPEDFIDPADNHIWRAKYCVLEDGILYFYRNETDGESTEAIRERQQSSSSDKCRTRPDNAAMDLSKSPVARELYHRLDSNGSGASSGSMWEKRVSLDCVGAVRSAERDYGPSSFELSGVSNDDDDDDFDPVDTLLLKARDSADMKEWIFQFHCSLASYVRNVVDVVGSCDTYLDADQTTLSRPKGMHSSGSERGLQRLLAASPKLKDTTPFSTTPLSHGHGRITLHRRRLDTAKDRPSPGSGVSPLSSMPARGGTKFAPLSSSLRSMSPGSHMLSMSLGQSSPNRVLLPPPSSRENKPSVPMPQSSIPEADIPKATTPPRHSQVSAFDDGETKLKSSGKKYVPPHLRKKLQESERNSQTNACLSNDGQKQPVGALHSLVADQQTTAPTVAVQEYNSEGRNDLASNGDTRTLDTVGGEVVHVKRGGCADPDLVQGSIMEPRYIDRKASKLRKGPSNAFGSFGGDTNEPINGALRWETGAVSECGIRDSNEDSYLIVHDLMNSQHCKSEGASSSQPPFSGGSTEHTLSLFAIFDGHCGNQAARYAAERLSSSIYNHAMAQVDDSTKSEVVQSPLNSDLVETVLQKSLMDLDDEFCRFCQEGGREWESGATALVAMVVNRHFVIGNLGDCRGVMCRREERRIPEQDSTWKQLNDGEELLGSGNKTHRCVWKEVAKVHNPLETNEKARIERANGWVTTETEIPIGQLRRMDFLDEDVVGILSRCLNDRYSENGDNPKECKAAPQRILQINRVCGELAVSRALGDRDFKAAFNSQSSSTDDGDRWWDCQLFLPYPKDHNRKFQGDLVSNTPDFQSVRIGGEGVSQEFLLLACDGLWDVMDVDDAVRVTRDVLFKKNWTAKRAAARLAELAIHLGSSDNVTVIVVRLLDDSE